MTLNVPLLEQRFELVAPMEEAKQACANEFYTALLRLHPEVETLFAQTNMQEQARKLIATLSLVLHALKKPDVLMSTLQRLGRRRKAGGSAGRALSDSNRGASHYVRLLVRGSMDNGDAGGMDREAYEAIVGLMSHGDTSSAVFTSLIVLGNSGYPVALL